MAIKKQLVADSGIFSQGAATVNGALSVTGATTANGVSANTVAVTNGVTANTYAGNTATLVTANANTFSGNNLALGATTANSTVIAVTTLNATNVLGTTANVTSLNATGLANVGTANVAGMLNVGGNTAITGNVTIGGTLTVSGGVTTINTTQVNIADNILTLNSDFTSGSPTENAGFEVLRGAQPTVGIRWNETADYFEASDATGSYQQIRLGGSTINLGADTVGNFVATVSGSGNGLTVSGAAGEATATTISIAAANTTTVGTVQLIDSVISANVTTAATPNSVKTAYDAAISANTLAAGKVSSVGGTSGRISSSGGTAPTLDLIATGVSAGTFTKLTVDVYGRATANGMATTDDITEGTNQYFTNARARGAMASGAGISFDAPSGTITNSDRGSDQLSIKSIADGAGTLQFAATVNQDVIRFANGAGLNLTFDAGTKKVTFDNAGVTSFNTRTGAVTLSGTDVTDAVGTIVNSFNTRTGAVTLSSGDISTALGYTPADAASAGGTNASALATGTVPTGRLSGAYTGITSIGTQVTDVVTDATHDVSSGRNVLAGGGLYPAAGSAGNPAHSFSADADTGMYRVGSNRIGFATSGVHRMEINASTTSVVGNFTATGTGTFSSDARLKTDIVDISPGEGMNVVLHLEPVKFTRLHDNTRSAGYIAQQFKIAAPEQVREDDEGMLSISVEGASPYHTAAIQFLASRVQRLEERLHELEAR